MKFKGLKKASSDTKNYGQNSGWYSELVLDCSTGEIWTITHYSLGMNEWTEYHDKNIIRVCMTTHHLKTDKIKELAEKEYTEWKNYYKEYNND